MRPMAMILEPGQGGDFPMSPYLMEGLSVSRLGAGRACSRTDRVLGNRAYSLKANRKPLRRRGIQAVVPERSDQVSEP